MSTWDSTIIRLLQQWAGGDTTILQALINAWYNRPFDDE